MRRVLIAAGFGIILLVSGDFMTMRGAPIADADSLLKDGNRRSAEDNLLLAQYDVALKLRKSFEPETRTLCYQILSDMGNRISKQQLEKDHVELARSNAPILCLTQSEPFGLRQLVVVIHPTEPVIGYHLFWDDDLDNPNDLEPCDHEIVWVRYNRDGEWDKTYTYYHGQILEGKPSTNAGVRPCIDIEWGKHGSLVPQWRRSPFLWSSLLVKYFRLKYFGRRNKEFSSAASWPVYFDRSIIDYFSFSKRLDTARHMKKTDIVVTRWANAAISELVSFNFAPKPDWPY